MKKLLDLGQLGTRLGVVDRLILQLASRRMELAEQVGAFKRQTGDKIFRSNIEDARLKKIEEMAPSYGLNPNFARTLLYTLINESCKRQMIKLQDEVSGTESLTEEEWLEVLKRNLLILTERCASTYDQTYDAGFFATKMCRDFEEELLCGGAEKVSGDLALHLGCATGRLTFKLDGSFAHVIGYDISPHMIDIAKRNSKDRDTESQFEFCVADIEQGIPAETASVSLVVMNLGTASDIQRMDYVWSEILRVLKPGGQFFLSFYNKDALLYRWELLPWPTGLAAIINPNREYLEVHSGNEILPVYARPYRVKEVEELLSPHVKDLRVLTYPTISAILPQDFFEGTPEVQEAVISIDRSLTATPMGAYIIAMGSKA